MEKRQFKVKRNTCFGRNGEYNTAELYSIRQEKELVPHKTIKSRSSGDYKEKIWYLLPGKYFECGCSYSRAGKGGWYLSVLTIMHDGQQINDEMISPPQWLIDTISPAAKNYLFTEDHS